MKTIITAFIAAILMSLFVTTAIAQQGKDETVRILKGKRIAILVEDNYDEKELWVPYYRFLEAGATVTLVGPEAKDYFSSRNLMATAKVAARQVSANDFDAVIIPGGYCPDRLRKSNDILNLVRGINTKGGIIAAICHAGWVPISAGIVKGKKMTATSSIKDDLINAGAIYIDQSVVVDGNLVSSRSPDDLPDFMPAIIKGMMK